jgi:WD40 repeat protein
LSVILLAAVSLTGVVLIKNHGDLSLNGFKRIFASKKSEQAASGFSFESGFNNVFADLDGSFVVASTVGIQMFNADGSKAYTEIYEMSNPAVTSSGALGAAYDLGGRVLKVFDAAGVLGAIKTDDDIISAALGGGGALALCTKASGGYKSYVYVYDSGAYDKPHFTWKSGDGYVLSAALSPDGKSLDVLTLTPDGSRIVFLSTDSTTEKGSCTLKGKLAMDIRFTDSGHALAVCSDALVRVGADGKSQVFADYSDKYLANYSVGGKFAAIVLSDYMVGDQGSLVSVDLDGKTLGTLETHRKIVSLSAYGDYLAVLYGDGFAVYDKNLKECAQSSDSTGAVRTIMRADGTALMITSHSASVFSSREG